MVSSGHVRAAVMPPASAPTAAVSSSPSCTTDTTPRSRGSSANQGVGWGAVRGSRPPPAPSRHAPAPGSPRRARRWLRGVAARRRGTRWRRRAGRAAGTLPGGAPGAVSGACEARCARHGDVYGLVRSDLHSHVEARDGRAPSGKQRGCCGRALTRVAAEEAAHAVLVVDGADARRHLRRRRSGPSGRARAAQGGLQRRWGAGRLPPATPRSACAS